MRASEPVWQACEKLAPDPTRCAGGEHRWVARFFQSGQLACWECADCGLRDRELGPRPAALDSLDGWPQPFPWLTAAGAQPPAGERRWRTAAGTLLVEGDPSSVHFQGELIPDLPAAHSYCELGPAGAILQTFEPGREQVVLYSSHYHLIRYQVVGDALLRYVSYCFEESSFDIPSADAPRVSVVLAGLTPL